ncbi:hypothetical protein DFH27DRAFT_215840 [Peziza echinospora]|nr:hypothetical protein DFH27DRAFT_215840 [Peziza echinospora]
MVRTPNHSFDAMCANLNADQYSPAEPTTHVDDESFSSATVVEAEDGHSSHEEEGPSPGENSEVANTSAETTHQRIQVHQFDDADSEAGDADAPTEDENIYALGVEGEEYTYEEETWQHNVDEILEHDPEYYQDGYVDGEYTEGDVLNGYVAEEEFTEENGDHYGGNENGNSEDDTTYPDAEGYEETETYEVFPQEVSEYDGVPGVRSPTAKRLREDEADPLDVQDIKRTRSH